MTEASSSKISVYADLLPGLYPFRKSDPLYRGIVAAEAGRWAEARTVFEREAAGDLRQGAVPLLLVRICKALGDEDCHRKWLGLLIRDEKTVLRSYRAEALLWAGRTDEASSVLIEAFDSEELSAHLFLLASFLAHRARAGVNAYKGLRQCFGLLPQAGVDPTVEVLFEWLGFSRTQILDMLALFFSVAQLVGKGSAGEAYRLRAHLSLRRLVASLREREPKQIVSASQHEIDVLEEMIRLDLGQPVSEKEYGVSGMHSLASQVLTRKDLDRLVKAYEEQDLGQYLQELTVAVLTLSYIIVTMEKGGEKETPSLAALMAVPYTLFRPLSSIIELHSVWAKRDVLARPEVREAVWRLVSKAEDVFARAFEAKFEQLEKRGEENGDSQDLLPGNGRFRRRRKRDLKGPAENKNGGVSA